MPIKEEPASGFVSIERIASVLAEECGADMRWEPDGDSWWLTLKRDGKKLVFVFDPAELADRDSEVFRRIATAFIERCLQEFDKPRMC